MRPNTTQNRIQSTGIAGASTLDRIFNMDEAASYLGVKEETVAYHVYAAKNLQPSRYIGRSPVFVKEDLDAFQLVRRRPGRPKMNKVSKPADSTWQVWMGREDPHEYAALNFVAWKAIVKRTAHQNDANMTDADIEEVARKLMSIAG